MNVNRGSAERAFRLTKRDLLLIEDVFDHRLMSSGHLLELGYFASVSRCNRRLRQLCRAGYLAPVAVASIDGSRHAVYRAGSAADEALAASATCPREEMGRLLRHGPSRTLAEHTLRIVDVRCLLHKVPRVTLDLWLPESRCRHEYSVGVGGAWHKHILRPDAYARLRIGGESLHLFIEVDLGTVSKKQIVAKLRCYERHAGGIFEGAYGASGFTVLFVTVNAARLRHLQKMAKLTPVAYAFATFATLRDAILSIIKECVA